MPIIDWNVSFMLGIQELDGHHKHLVKLLNAAYDDFREGVNIDKSKLDELVDYAAFHFAVEESLMLETQYPDIPSHKAEHETFTGRLLDFKKNFNQRRDVSVELLWFLCNWVTHHVRVTDAAFGHHIDVHNINKKMARAAG